MRNNLLVANQITQLSHKIFSDNRAVGWWTQEDEELILEASRLGKYTKGIATVIGSKLALVHSEVSEALEGMRKNLMDDHLPNRKMIEVELADAVIRIFDLAGYLDLDIGTTIIEKLNYNAQRADHKLENRNSDGGKTI